MTRIIEREKNLLLCNVASTYLCTLTPLIRRYEVNHQSLTLYTWAKHRYGYIFMIGDRNALLVAAKSNCHNDNINKNLVLNAHTSSFIHSDIAS